MLAQKSTNANQETQETQETCSNCRFWFPLDYGDDQLVGKCRRYPPTLYMLVDENNVPSRDRSLFPRTAHDKWCGEWREKEGRKEPKKVVPYAGPRTAYEYTTLLSKPIAELDLTRRTYNNLIAEEINTIGELVQYSASFILRIPNIGRKAQREIIDCLAEKGLRLAPEKDCIGYRNLRERKGW